jgi:hypothetical protein
MPLGKFCVSLGKFHASLGKFHEPLGKFHEPLGKFHEPLGKFYASLGKFYAFSIIVKLLFVGINLLLIIVYNALVNVNVFFGGIFKISRREKIRMVSS